MPEDFCMSMVAILAGLLFFNVVIFYLRDKVHQRDISIERAVKRLRIYNSQDCNFSPPVITDNIFAAMIEELPKKEKDRLRTLYEEGR